MRICLGATRIVLLSGDHAYKIARIRPIKVSLKLLSVLWLPSHYILLHEVYDYRTLRAIWKYLFAGLYANWAEERLWFETRDERFIPTLKCLWWGS